MLSPAFNKKRRAYSSYARSHLAFQEVAWKEEFDGIWACASLLHVAMRELHEVLVRLGRALRRGGVLYVSFKHGRGEREHDGRRFTDLDEPRLRVLLEAIPDVRVKECWHSQSIQPKRVPEMWINAIALKGL
jgi:hypothetical protein